MDANIPANADITTCALFTKRCIESYLANWQFIHYKYSAYSGSYIQLPPQYILILYIHIIHIICI